MAQPTGPTFGGATLPAIKPLAPPTNVPIPQIRPLNTGLPQVANNLQMPQYNNPGAQQAFLNALSNVKAIQQQAKQAAGNIGQPQPDQGGGGITLTPEQQKALFHAPPVQLGGTGTSTGVNPNLQQHTSEGLMGALGNVWNHTVAPVMNDVRGGLEGALNPALQQNATLEQKYGPLVRSNPNVIYDGHGLRYKNVPVHFTNPLAGLIQGLLHPGQSHQQYTQNQAQAETGQSALAKIAENVPMDTGTSASSYIPGVVIAKPIKVASKVSGLSSALKFVKDLVMGTIKEAHPEDVSKAVETISKAAGTPTKVTRTMPKLTPEQAKAINEAAGITGATPVTKAVQVSKMVPKIARPGTMVTPAAKSTQALQHLFDVAKQRGLSTGRELEDLQNLLSSVSDRNGVSLDSLINQSTDFPRVGEGAVQAAKNVPNFDVNPAQAPQMFNKSTKTVQKAVQQDPNFTLQGHLPAVIPQAAESSAPVAEQAAKATGKGPYAAYGWQSKVGAPMAKVLQNAMPNGSSTAKTAANVVKRVFSTLPGVSSHTKQALSEYYGEMQSRKNGAFYHLANAIKDAGLTPAEQGQFTHLLESTPHGTAFSNPKYEAVRQKIEPMMESMLKELQGRGLIDNTLDLKKMKVSRYLPHVYSDANKIDSVGTKLTDGTFLRKNVDANKIREVTGTIKDINANEHPLQPKFETNIVKILGHYLAQGHEGIAADNLIKKVVDKSIPLNNADKLTVGSIDPATGTKLVRYVHGGKTVLMPEKDAQLLDGIHDTNKEDGFGKFYKGLVNGTNKMMFAGSPFTHIVNNLGFQTLMHDPGAFADMPQYMKEAFTGVVPGSKMDKALQAGALNLSSEIGAKGGTEKQLNQLVKSVDGSKNVVSSIGKGYLQATPNLEKAYRAAVFNRLTDKGVSSADAANYVRSIFGGHIAPNVMSDFEHGVSSFLPFFNWTKTAIGSNLKNMARNPLPYSAMIHTANDTNKTATGHGMLGNPNPASIAIPGSKDAKGNQQYYQPYNPLWDVLKLGKSIGTEGIAPGALDFGFSRMNSIAKTLAEYISQKQNPLAPVDQQYNFLTDPYSSANAPDNKQGILFGNKGPKMNPYPATALQNLSVPGLAELSAFLTKNGRAGLPQLLHNQLLQGLTSGTSSAPNPASMAKEQAYIKKQQLAAHRKANKGAIG